MKYQLVGTMIVLGLTVAAAHAQPPENAPIPVAKQAQDYAREERERAEQARRAPNTMLQHFLWSMGANDYEAAALCVAGADNTPWLRSLQEKSRRQERLWLQLTPLFTAAEVQGDEFTARVATSPSVGDSLMRQEMQPLLARIEQVHLVREGEFWKIVPRPQPTAPADANEIVARSRDENDGFLNQWARLLLAPPPDAQTRQERAEIARLARRAPDTMLQHFVTSINANDLEMAAGDVVGGEATVWLRRLQDNLQRQTPDWQIIATPLFDAANGDQFTARVATALRLGADETNVQTQNLLARFEQVDVRSDDGEWRIVPRVALPELQFDGQNVAIENQTQLDALQMQMAQKTIERGRDERDGFINQWARIMPQAREMMMRVTVQTSMSNLKQLGLGVLQLTQDYDEVYAFTPDTFAASVQPYVKSQVIFEIPTLDEARTGRYQFNSALAGKPSFPMAQPALTPMIYEPGKGPRGLDYRFGGQAAVCFADGHVALVTPEQADKLVWNVGPIPSG